MWTTHLVTRVCVVLLCYMKILLGCNNFSYLSGSPLYVYTLAYELRQLGHEVTIYSPMVGGVLEEKADEAGIVTVTTLDPASRYDVMHLNQTTSQVMLDTYDVPAVYTIHSEFPCEDPLRDARIQEYIAIRPSIAEQWGIDCTIIYNPIDFRRFHPYPKPSKPLTLFVGTIDYLRMESARHLIESGKRCRFVGKKFATWADGMENWFPEAWDIEDHLKDATETAGIMLGRTSLEGFAAGLPAIIYDVDTEGRIKSITEHQPPEDMSFFDSQFVVKQVLEVYNKAIDAKKI